MADILFEQSDGIAVITFNRPEKKNCVSHELENDLYEYMQKINRDKGIRVVVVTGGPDVFCAGTDLKSNVGSYSTPWDWRVRQGEYCRSIRAMIKPVIASINGYCMGGGFEMSLNADIRYASKSALFASPESKLGVLGGGGVTQILPRIIGRGKAAEMIMTGDTYTAEEAYEMGLIERLYDTPEELKKGTFEFASKIAAMSSSGQQLVKKALRVSDNIGVDMGMDYENELLCVGMSTKDAIESQRAFVEKRKPVLNK
ncbi:MAG: enoyl-CoA hydratase/isomerase family protein [Anaerovoracaceae bacterium]|jgi:enoyl-CoA hydratase/carnithine racemase